MKRIFPAFIAGSAIILLLTACSSRPETDYGIKPVGFTAVRLDDVFWSKRLKTNREVTVPHNLKMAEETGRVNNFDLAARALAGDKEGKFYTNYPFDDSDVYKIIEAAAYTLASHPLPELDEYIDGLIAKIAAAQEPDGYLYTARTIGGPPPVDWLGEERWSNLYMSHELYNLGHLYEAAAAYYEATGKKNLLNIAVNSARLLLKEFGPGKRQNPPGHQEIEIGLVKLYRVTGNPRYLELARFFIDARGKAGTHELYGEYSQDHRPLVEQTEAVGHAVRAGYFYAGAADVAALTGDGTYLEALNRIWEDVVSSKMYLTGGIGATGAWEGYGPAYHLPNASAYAETCAAVATFLWNSRMFRLEEDAKFVDVMERILYNGLLSGVSLSGDRFFYSNPLASFGHHERTPWFSCACCPPNAARLIASVPGYLYAVGRGKVYVNLYAQGTAEMKVNKTGLEIRQTTDYPWSGNIRLDIKPGKPATFTLMIRIPGWALGRPVPSDLYGYIGTGNSGPVVKVNGQEFPLVLEKGYLPVQREWHDGDTVELVLPMEPRRVVAHEAVKADLGRVAVERGPLVYCAEWADNGGRTSNLVMEDSAVLEVEATPGLLEGVVVVKAAGQSLIERAGKTVSEKQEIVLIPYYSWANRGQGEMAVWLARTSETARVAREPGLEAKAMVTASDKAVNLRAVNDQYEPESSADGIGYMHWWPDKGSLEWIEYKFEKAVILSEASVYWFDDTGTGQCRVPTSWRLLHGRPGKWIPVDTRDEFGTEEDKYNKVRFTPVLAEGLRLEIQLQEKWSAGIHEWKVR